MVRVILSSQDPYKNSFIVNGRAMYHLVISYLQQYIDEESLQNLAYKVAAERLAANVNIGEFVYNVSIGRSEILDHFPEIGLSIGELHPVINQINLCFDKFLHYAVQHYTELKDKHIEEQTCFIEQNYKDRLTILGQMSSSFVHEFRNPLTSVIGFAQLLQEKYPELEYIEIMSKELNQLKFRIAQFLMVSKKEVKDKAKETFQLALIFEEMVDFLYPMIVSSDVLVETDIDPTLHLYGYRDEFRQVLINIIINSLDALADTTQEQKTIRVAGCVHNNHAVMNISNNGPAIAKDAIVSIFEPFFTTKKLGTGIGLYISRKIIEEHSGSIRCESNDSWTNFRIVMPAS